MSKVCFVVDCTMSMRNCWGSVLIEIESILRTSPVFTEFALIAYRDIGEEKDMTSVGFTTDRTEILKTLWGVQPEGGIDTAEDVAGALREATLLDWGAQSGIRTLLHFADAPAHGDQFHGGLVEDRFPNGDPRGYHPLDYVNVLARMNVNYDFYRFNDSTDIMTEQFAGRYEMELGSFCIIGKLNISETSQEEELYSSISPVCYCQTESSTYS